MGEVEAEAGEAEADGVTHILGDFHTLIRTLPITATATRLGMDTHIRRRTVTHTQ